MKKALVLILQTIALVLVYRACVWFVSVTGFPVPANVLGILVLFMLLCFGVIKEQWLAEAAQFWLKHLVFFFIPITVGLMDWGAVFAAHALILTAAVLASSLLPLLGVTRLVRLLRKEKQPCPK